MDFVPQSAARKRPLKPISDLHSVVFAGNNLFFTSTNKLFPIVLSKMLAKEREQQCYQDWKYGKVLNEEKG